MDKDKLIELTNKIYRMTLLFPKKEPLRYKMREAADEILANFVFWEALRDFNPGNFADDWEKRYKDSVFLTAKYLEILKSYFEVTKWQNWLSYFDVLEIEEEYDRIKSNFKKEIEDLEKGEKNLKMKPLLPIFKVDRETDRDLVSVANVGKGRKEKLDSRKEKILKILEEKDRAQVWEIKKILPEVSKRTLRRDFDQLLKLGLVERIGERNNTFYKLTL